MTAVGTRLIFNSINFNWYNCLVAFDVSCCCCCCAPMYCTVYRLWRWLPIRKQSLTMSRSSSFFLTFPTAPIGGGSGCRIASTANTRASSIVRDEKSLMVLWWGARIDVSQRLTLTTRQRRRRRPLAPHFYYCAAAVESELRCSFCPLFFFSFFFFLLIGINNEFFIFFSFISFGFFSAASAVSVNSPIDGVDIHPEPTHANIILTFKTNKRKKERKRNTNKKTCKLSKKIF